MGECSLSKSMLFDALYRYSLMKSILSFEVDCYLFFHHLLFKFNRKYELPDIPYKFCTCKGIQFTNIFKLIWKLFLTLLCRKIYFSSNTDYQISSKKSNSYRCKILKNSIDNYLYSLCYLMFVGIVCVKLGVNIYRNFKVFSYFQALFLLS